MITIIWLMVTLLLVIIELVTVNVTTVWFIFSAIVAMILNYYNIDFYIQVLSFIGVGVMLYVFLKPAVEKKIFKKRMKYFNNNINSKKGKVIKTILPDRDGEVKIEGKRWSARSKDAIKTGEIIRVKKTDGLTLIVEKVKKAKK